MSNCSVKGEDEEELESLRLAALESLRAKGLPPPILNSIPTKPALSNNQVNLINIKRIIQHTWFAYGTNEIDSFFLFLSDFSTSFGQSKFNCHHSSRPVRCKNQQLKADKLEQHTQPV